MPRSSRPRKARRPRLASRPILAGMRDELILPAYVAIESLRAGTDQAELESAHNALAALVNYMQVACQMSGRSDDEALIRIGAQALASIMERHGETGVYRGTGGELQALRVAVAQADRVLPLLGTACVTQALLAVDRALYGAIQQGRHA